MEKKFVILGITLLMAINSAFSQDTSSNKKPDNIYNANNITDTSTLNSKQDPDKPHASINPNVGTSIPSTTSGTLNSSVNPNTQFVVPFGGKKKKTNSNVNKSSETNTKPGNK